jgi:hypothetical protein
MKALRFPLLAIALALPGALVFAQEPLTANAIMARVAAHQDSAEAERAHYVYIQHARVVSHKGKRILCEETTDSRVTPSDKGSHQELLKLDGRLLHKDKYVTYTQLPKPGDKGAASTDPDDVDITIGNDDTDRDLVENMRKNLTNRDPKDSKDGFSSNLFPLTTKEQANEDFKLLGQENMSGRNVFHITFSPKDKSDYGWKGDAFIDTTAFQPVLVRTTLSRNIPLAVRALLGTNVPGLGFTITYAPQPGGIWFPISFGTEFKIKVLFFFSREISISAQNRDFEKTHVTSTIVGDLAPTGEPPQN